MAGVIVVGGLEAPVAARLAGASVWCAILAMQFQALRRGWATCVAFRLHADGRVTVLGPDGEWCEGTLEADSVLLRRWGWIRLRAGSGAAFGELVRGSCRESREWRRLQVVWRHVGAGQ